MTSLRKLIVAAIAVAVLAPIAAPASAASAPAVEVALNPQPLPPIVDPHEEDFVDFG